MKILILILSLISVGLLGKEEARFKNGKREIYKEVIEYETSRDFFFYNYETCSCHKKISPKIKRRKKQ